MNSNSGRIYNSQYLNVRSIRNRNALVARNKFLSPPSVPSVISKYFNLMFNEEVLFRRPEITSNSFYIYFFNLSRFDLPKNKQAVHRAIHEIDEVLKPSKALLNDQSAEPWGSVLKGYLKLFDGKGLTTLFRAVAAQLGMRHGMLNIQLETGVHNAPFWHYDMPVYGRAFSLMTILGSGTKYSVSDPTIGSRYGVYGKFQGTRHLPLRSKHSQRQAKQFELITYRSKGRKRGHPPHQSLLHRSPEFSIPEARLLARMTFHKTESELLRTRNHRSKVRKLYPDGSRSITIVL